jgi:serine/threonine protein phosphatase PrpC
MTLPVLSGCVFRVGASSTNGVREENQDRLTSFQSPFGHLFVLADGMGGHKGGALAAGIATSMLPQILRSLPASTPAPDALVQSIDRLNTVIVDEGRSSGSDVEGMGSTLVVLLVRHTPDGALAIGAHVGDSRIYFLRNDRLFCLTRDHTMVRDLLDAGALTPEQAVDHPQASVLTRALGREGPVAVDLTSWMQVQVDDMFLLCSDGLSAYAEMEDIQATLAQPESPQVIAEMLVRLALRESSEDNISVLVVRAEPAAADPG